MFAALVLVPIVAFTHVGGVAPTFSMKSTLLIHIYWIFLKARASLALFLFSLGLGYYGQPHIIVRFMAIKDIKDLKPARRIGMSWMIITVLGSVLTGLIGVAYAHKFGVAKDPEMIFIIFSKILFHH